MSELFHGVVAVFTKKGYGFISWKKDGVEQPDMFCHYSDISADGYKILYKGQKVSFQIGVNNLGKPKAINVTVNV